MAFGHAKTSCTTRFGSSPCALAAILNDGGAVYCALLSGPMFATGVLRVSCSWKRQTAPFYNLA
eukprot:3459979-Amphidinium_carterae.2